MAKNTFLIIVLLVVVFAGVVWFLGKRGGEEISSPQPTPTPTQLPVSPTPTPTSSLVGSPVQTPAPTPIPKTVVINMTDSGFNPAEMTINAGDIVRFVNQGNQARWPASGIHPTHDLYPKKGGCISSSFDACRGLSKGESFSFTFTFKGTWPFHDHLNPFNPSLKGKVIVQ